MCFRQSIEHADYPQAWQRAVQVDTLADGRGFSNTEYRPPCGRASGSLQSMRFNVSLGKEVEMLSTVVLWTILTRDKRGLIIVAAFLLLVAFAVLAWNIAP